MCCEKSENNLPYSYGTGRYFSFSFFLFFFWGGGQGGGGDLVMADKLISQSVVSFGHNAKPYL